VEVQPDAEHQQDDADLRELRGEGGVAHVPGRVGADDNTRQQVPDDRRELEPLRDEPEDPGGGERSRYGGDEGEVVHRARF
jgi:hypothetical protein